MRISDWSSDVCSSDLRAVAGITRAEIDCRIAEVTDRSIILRKERWQPTTRLSGGQRKLAGIRHRPCAAAGALLGRQAEHRPCTLGSATVEGDSDPFRAELRGAGQGMARDLLDRKSVLQGKGV